MTDQPTTPARRLSLPHTDALWDAIAIPGPAAPTFVEQHERVCRVVAGILDELTPAPDEPDTDRAALREQLLDALDFSYCQGLGYESPEVLLDAFEASLASQTRPKATSKSADRAVLGDRIADALAAADGWTWATGFDRTRSPAWQGYRQRADAVLAVLPTDGYAGPCNCRYNPALTAEIGYPVRCPHCPPGVAAVPPTHWSKHVQRHHPEASPAVLPTTDQAAIDTASDTAQPGRAAVLREVADWLKVWRPEFFERWAIAEQDRYEDGVDDAADELRRMAAEAQQPTTETRASWTPGPVALARAADWATKRQDATVDPAMCPRCKGDNSEEPDAGAQQPTTSTPTHVDEVRALVAETQPAPVAQQPADCLFCQPDTPTNRHVARHGTCYARHDNYPATPGHMEILPVRHVASVHDLTPAEILDMHALLRQITTSSEADGWTIGINEGPAAGRTIDHLHVHVIPRRWGDVVDPRGGVRHVLPGTDADAWTAPVAQQPETEAPPCVHCTHLKRDHDGHADHRARYSPLVVGDPWCHACTAVCDYAQQPAAGDTTKEARNRVKHSGPDTKFCVLCLSGEHERIDEEA